MTEDSMDNLDPETNEPPKSPQPVPTNEPEVAPPETLRFSSGLTSPRTFFWPRIVLYGFVMAAGAFYLLYRASSPAVPHAVFLNTDRITEINWPDLDTRIVLENSIWWVENSLWGRAPADETQVLLLIHQLRDARGLAVSKIPGTFRPAGRMEVVTSTARRTLLWHASGADALLESHQKRFLLPRFVVEKLFPAPETLVVRKMFTLDPDRVTQLSLTVATAAGERGYRVLRENGFYYIPGTHSHLLHGPALRLFLEALQDLTFRRLLAVPSSLPAHPDFSFTQDQTTAKLVRIEGSCPGEELAVARFEGTLWLAGCVSRRLWNRLIPALPSLLEARVLPTPDAGTWNRIEIRRDKQSVVLLERTPNGWVTGDGRAADERLCTELLEAFGSAPVLGLEPPLETTPCLEILFASKNQQFSIGLIEQDPDTFLIRQGENRRARVSRALVSMVRPELAHWLDRRLIPKAEYTRIQRQAGTFSEVWARQDDKTWQVLEPLDIPYEEDLTGEIVPRLLELRSLSASASGQDPASSETAADRIRATWILTRADGGRVTLVATPDAHVVRVLDTDPVRLEVSPGDRDFLLRPFHAIARPSWKLAETREVRIRHVDGTTATLSFHEPHWLWTHTKKQLLTPATAQAFFLATEQDLLQAEPWDLGSFPDCPVRISFSSDAGIRQEYCLNPTRDAVFLMRPTWPGRVKVPATFLTRLEVPSP